MVHFSIYSLSFYEVFRFPVAAHYFFHFFFLSSVMDGVDESGNLALNVECERQERTALAGYAPLYRFGCTQN